MIEIGDFYVTYGEDAVVCMKLLALTNAGTPSEPIVAIPRHGVEMYFTRLAQSGKRLAVAPLDGWLSPLPGDLKWARGPKIAPCPSSE